MYMNTAYLKNTLISPRTPLDQEDLKTPLRILCCGVYRIDSIPRLDTERPYGRKDYQLLYLHSGQGHFYFDGADGEETIVRAGQMILFRPKDIQIYYYYGGSKTEVYWVHFTGNRVHELLSHYGFDKDKKILKSGVYLDYKNLFWEMITELQLGKPGYEEMLSLMLRRLFLLIQRNRSQAFISSTAIQKEIENAIRYFNENYKKEIVVQDYAKEHFLSPCWFSRNFKQITGFTPTQYITSVRIANAQTLLAGKSYSVNEVAAMVGYDDPLYFSRAFKKHIGYSPKAYQKMLQEE